MVDAKIVQHASGNPRQSFVSGYVIFFITSKDKWSLSKGVHFDMFSKL